MLRLSENGELVLVLQGEENMLRLSENGELVLVTEQLVCDGQNQRQRIILRVNVSTV